MGKDAQVARAFGKGDWKKVIELESAALDKEEHKQFSYAMIGMAYENMNEVLSICTAMEPLELQSNGAR